MLILLTGCVENNVKKDITGKNYKVTELVYTGMVMSYMPSYEDMIVKIDEDYVLTVDDNKIENEFI